MAQSGGGEEKTERGTPKKRADARKEGQVLKSQEVTTAVSVCVMFGAIRLLAPYMFKNICELLERYLTGEAVAGDPAIAANLTVMFNNVILELFMIIGPLFAISLVIGLAINLVQVGFLFTTKPLMPKFSKINPLEGFKRIFSLRSVIEMLKSVLKVAIIAIISYQEFMLNFGSMSNLMAYDIADAGIKIFDMCMSLAFKTGIALIAIGVADYAYQWYEHEKGLKMTKQEVKDEYKMTEGDPKIKGKIKQKQQEMSQKRMMASVPQADVVITNPTHYAVALRYDDKQDSAPVLIAKGKDFVAQKIKEIAREHKIELVENKPLAQAIYFNVDVGKQIPEDLFGAVAEVLAYVYNLKNPQQRTQSRGNSRGQNGQNTNSGR